MIIIKKEKDYPIIYLRYLKGNLMYVGETQSFLKGRHVRDDLEVGDFDIVKVLKAPKNLKRRHYWEAYLIIKLKPIMQISAKGFKKYLYRVEFANGRNKKKSYNYRNKKYPINEDEKKLYLFSAYDHLKKFKYFITKAKKA